MKCPQSDGKLENYHRQKALELSLTLRDEATDILQTLNTQKQDDYKLLMKHIELWNYHQWSPTMCIIWRTAKKKPKEPLQEFEADVARCRCSTKNFLDDFWDHETRQAFILTRPDQLVDVLEFEAANNQAEARYEF